MTSSLEFPPILEPMRASIESLLAPCVLLVPAEQPTLSQLCGKPRLAPGSAWPEGPDGPLRFVGQIDLADAASAGGVELGLPERGLLGLFCDAESFWTGEQPNDRRRFHLVYTPDPERAVELDAPPDLDDLADAEPLACRRGMSLPGFADRAIQRYESLKNDKRMNAYIELCVAFVDDQFPPAANDHRLRGHATWQTDDGRLAAQLASSGLDARRDKVPRAKALAPGAAEWNLLWQVETINLSGWEDVGAFHVLIRDADLAARAFDRAWVLHQTL